MPRQDLSAPPVMSAASDPLRAVGWMILATLAFVGVNAGIKMVGPEIPSPQAAFIRFLFGILFFLPVLPRIARARFPASLWFGFGLRGLLHLIAVLCWFYAMARLPVVEISAIGFLNPIIVLLVAGVVLREGLSLRRILVVLMGFLGALIVLRPGLREVNLAHLSQLGAATGFALSYVVAKTLSRRASPEVIVAMMTLVVTLGVAPIAALVWVPIGFAQVMWLALAAVCASSGHLALARALRAAPMSVSQPASFLQVVWSAALGWLAFGEMIDPFVVLGAAVIISAISIDALMESRASRRAAREVSCI